MIYAELYQEIIMDHYRNPRNKKDLSDKAEAVIHENPLCGDSVKVDVVFDKDVLRNVYFDGAGCAIFTASASIMTEILAGMDSQQGKETIRRFMDWLKTGGELPDMAGKDELEVFCELFKYPVRIKCALLPWHALLQRLEAGS